MIFCITYDYVTVTYNIWQMCNTIAYQCNIILSSESKSKNEIENRNKNKNKINQVYYL